MELGKAYDRVRTKEGEVIMLKNWLRQEEGI